MGQLPRPLSNEELQALRDKAAVKPATKPATASEIAYESGIKVLGPVVQRVELLEKKVTDQEERIQRLEKTIEAIVNPNSAPRAKEQK